jgi:hypothetical protein
MTIGRSCLVALTLFLLYNLVLASGRVRARFVPQSMRQQNVIQAQDYVARATPPQVVVVGTSMAARLPLHQLRTEAVNLAMYGDSLFTGLEVIRRSEQNPQIVLIETNLLMNELNPEVVGTVFRPVFHQLRPHLPALRERFQPANLVTGAWGEPLLRRVLRIVQRATAAKSAPPESDATPPPPQTAPEARLAALLAAGLAGQEEVFAIAPEADRLDRQVDALRVAVQDLDRRGIRSAFLQMPVYRSLADLPLTTRVHEALEAAFPPDRFLWIRPQEPDSYETTDGLHLGDAEARRYASELTAALEAAGVLPADRSRRFARPVGADAESGS